MHIDALGIYAGHHVPDGAVFSCRVHRLKNYSTSPSALRVEHFLKIGEQRYALLAAISWPPACLRN